MAIAERLLSTNIENDSPSVIAHRLGTLAAVAHSSQREGELHSFKSEQIARVIRATRASKLILKSVLPNYDQLIGAGSRSFVFAVDGQVEKQEFSTAGMNEAALSRRTIERQANYQRTVGQFGHLVHPTTFDIGQLTLRPLGAFDVSRATQEQVVGVDLFSPMGLEMVRESEPGSTLRQEAIRLADGAREWRQSDLYLDVNGRENVLVIGDGPDAHLAIIDVDPAPYAPGTPNFRMQHNIDSVDNLERTAAHTAHLV